MTLNYDFIGTFIVVFIASVGYNIYQNFQYRELFAEHVDLSWTAQDTEASLIYTRKQLESCKKGTVTDPVLPSGNHIKSILPLAEMALT